MNALSCIHWFVLTLVPMGLSAAFLLFRYCIGRDKAFWRRGGVVLGIALIILLPFLLPYIRVAKLYGFVRTEEDATAWSARPVHWVSAAWQNKLWNGLGISPDRGERTLFPGLLPLLLALAAFFIVEPISKRAPQPLASRVPLKAILAFLDALAITAAITAALAIGYGTFRLRFLNWELLRVTDLTLTLVVFTMALLIRFSLAFPHAFLSDKKRNFIEVLRSRQRSTAFILAMLWIVIGFLGSFGMNFFFHRALYKFIPLFRSVRVPARWSMICYVGLAVLAGIGASYCVALVARHQPGIKRAAVYLVIIVALLFELRVAPMELFHGAVDPDQLTLRLKETPMSGGIVELPVDDAAKYRYTLRAADHGRPLVTAISGFPAPFVSEIEGLVRLRPIPDRFLDLLESIPTSYLVVHHAYLSSEDRQEVESILARGVAAGRLRLVQSYGSDLMRDDLFVVTKTEPTVKGEASSPSPVLFFEKSLLQKSGSSLNAHSQ